MEEKVLVRGSFTKKNLFVIVSFVLAVVFFVISCKLLEEHHWQSKWWKYIITDALAFYPVEAGIFGWAAIFFFVLAIFLIFQMSFCELCVTDKRVYGKTAFGKRVDLPIDKISSVGTCIPQGIMVATSSGAIRFWLLTNREEVYNAISSLLGNRQAPAQTQRAENENNSLEDLKKLKELLDMGVITQEEFDAKKKQLLGL